MDQKTWEEWIKGPGKNGSKHLGRMNQRTLEERIKGPGKNGSKDLGRMHQRTWEEWIKAPGKNESKNLGRMDHVLYVTYMYRLEAHWKECCGTFAIEDDHLLETLRSDLHLLLLMQQLVVSG